MYACQLSLGSNRQPKAAANKEFTREGCWHRLGHCIRHQMQLRSLRCEQHKLKSAPSSYAQQRRSTWP